MKITEFFNFVNERESIRLKKESNASFPWTEDKILRDYKFTNVRRENDKTSKKLISMYYSKFKANPKQEILFNCAIFRYFGTWEFAQTLGWSKPDNGVEYIREIAKKEKSDKRKTFTSAYVISNLGKSGDKIDVVLDYVIVPLIQELPRLIEISERNNSWQEVSEEMYGMMGFGGSGFMVKEVTLDTIYTNFWANGKPADYYSWTPIGPGGIRGSSRVLGNDSAKTISNEEALSVIMKLYEDQSLWKYDGILAPTDIQFQLCEFDKYERVRLGQGTPKNKYQQGKLNNICATIR